MKISDILISKDFTYSLEVFPPKEWSKLEKTKATVASMLESSPDFMSVTYGAAGTTSGYTSEITKAIIEDGFTPLAHLTCLTSTKSKVDSVINEMKANGVENILALRGDIPEGFVFPDKQYFRYAYELVNEIKALGDFCIGGACYPETHPESKSPEADLENLKNKVSCGIDFLTTQMFFDNSTFLSFKDKCLNSGIEAPIIAGIMPITSPAQINRIIFLSGCKIPKELLELVDKYKDSPEDLYKAGLDHCINQILSLKAAGQKYIHIYTMNKPDAAKAILSGIR